jgi:hypothetical protein
MYGMMTVPAFGADEPYLGEWEDEVGEDEGDEVGDDRDDIGEDEDVMVIGDDGQAYIVSGRGLRRGGRRLRRCRQARNALAEQAQDEGGAELGYASPRRVARVVSRIDRNQERLARIAPPVRRKRQVPVRATTINIKVGGAGSVAGQDVEATLELRADTYLDKLVFNESSAGASILRIEANETVIWRSETSDGLPCSAFTTSSQHPFPLAGVKIAKGTQLIVRGRVAADNDKINALFFGKKKVEGVGCGF